MRLLHPRTLYYVCFEMMDEDFYKSTVSRRQIVSHAWSEMLKYLATEQSHPKMFLSTSESIAKYMALVKFHGDLIGCNLNEQHLVKYDEIWFDYIDYAQKTGCKIEDELISDVYSFNESYLFSDATSLYFKGVNIFPYIYGDSWRKYVPIENLNEIYRVVGKTLGKDK